MIDGLVSPRTARSAVGIVVLNWNGYRDTVECMESVRLIDYEDVLTIIVDNGSTDGSYELLRARYPDTVVLRSDENLGFAEGNNLGMREALARGVDYVFVLNNDTIVDPLILRRLVDAADADPTIGVVGPVMFYYDDRDTVWFYGVRLWWPAGHHRPFGGRRSGELEPVVNTEYVAGAGMLLRAQMLAEVGLFDSLLFASWEDVELCARAKSSGWRVVAVSAAHLWHKVSATAGSKLTRYFNYRNRLLYYRKTKKGVNLGWLAVLIWHFASLLRLFVMGFSRRDLSEARAAWMGTVDYFRNNFGPGRMEFVSRKPR